MEKPVLSPDFTIEDIHKIRERSYERTKDMTVAEKLRITIISERKQKERLKGEGH